MSSLDTSGSSYISGTTLYTVDNQIRRIPTCPSPHGTVPGTSIDTYKSRALECLSAGKLFWAPGAMACVLLFRLFLLLVLASFAQGNRLGPTSPLRYSRFLDPSHAVFLRWDFDHEAEIITFELQVQTTGWVGLGITDRYTFVGSDLVVGGVLPNGNVYFSVSLGISNLF